MNFEEFEADYANFVKFFGGKMGKMPEMNFIKDQYQKYLLDEEDAKYFHPYNNFDEEFKIFSKQNYKSLLYKIFEMDLITDNQIFYFVVPSFKSEYLLVITPEKDKFTLKYTILNDNYWCKNYYQSPSDKLNLNVEKIILFSDLNIETGEKILFLLDNVFAEAKPKKSGMHMLDGVMYYISKIINGKRVYIAKPSPDENTKSQAIIDILEFLIANLNNLDSVFDDEIAKKIDELLE